MRSEKWYLRSLVGILMLVGATAAVAEMPRDNHLVALQKQVEDQALAIKELKNQLASLRQDHDHRLNGLGQQISQLDTRDAQQHARVSGDMDGLRQRADGLNGKIDDVDRRALHGNENVRIFNEHKDSCMDWRDENDGPRNTHVIQGYPCSGHPHQRWSLRKW